MKAHIGLFIIISLMQLLILLNVTILNDKWNGLLIGFSSIMYLIATIIVGVKMQRGKQKY